MIVLTEARRRRILGAWLGHMAGVPASEVGYHWVDDDALHIGVSGRGVIDAPHPGTSDLMDAAESWFNDRLVDLVLEEDRWPAVESWRSGCAQSTGDS